jgi:XTP/dITP diphosphohydrolase
MKIVLATHNRDKMKEIRAILDVPGLSLLSLDDFPDAPEVEEDGSTFEENALKKARSARDFTGISAIADDSGLEVEALEGAPGIFSSRYAGANVSYADNNTKLLAELTGLPDEKRGARFRCCMALALVSDEGNRVYGSLLEQSEKAGIRYKLEGKRVDSLVTEGRVHGRILRESRGFNGFGYDPVFEIPQLGKTLAEIGPEEKNRISHRYRALVEMRELIIKHQLF